MIISWIIQTPCYNYFLDVRNGNSLQIHDWIKEFFSNLNIPIVLKWADTKITDEIIDFPIDCIKMSDRVGKILPNSTLIFVKNNVKFTDKECIWGAAYGNFIGISRIAKEIFWHELYHKIGLEHCDKCIMKWDNPGTLGLCSNCKDRLEKCLKKG